MGTDGPDKHILDSALSKTERATCKGLLPSIQTIQSLVLVADRQATLTHLLSPQTNFMIDFVKRQYFKT
jgi:hypothetical protein